MNPKKYLNVLILVLMAVTIGSCKDSDDEPVNKTPLLLLEKANTSPEDLRLEYYRDIQLMGVVRLSSIDHI